MLPNIFLQTIDTPKQTWKTVFWIIHGQAWSENEEELNDLNKFCFYFTTL